jgi:hypothetical protein
MRRGPAGLLVAALIVAPLGLAACGGRFTLGPDEAPSAARQTTTTTGPALGPTNGATTATTAPTAGAGSEPTLPARSSVAGQEPASGGTAAPTPRTTNPGATPTHQAILNAYDAYLTDLSGLDDTLSKGYIAPLASVTTTRLAQASVRQAAAILAAKEHGVGLLRDDHVTVDMTGSTSAALADCQDEDHFYLVSDAGVPDPFVARGDYAGSAQLVFQDGHWLVDVFTTTHVPCVF